MANQHFFMRLLLLRPSFVADMSPDNTPAHGRAPGNIQTWFDDRQDPALRPGAGHPPFGDRRVRGRRRSQARRIMDKDPTVVAGLNSYDLAPMRVAAARALSG